MLIEPLAPARIDAALALWTAAEITRPWNDPQADSPACRTTPPTRR